MVPAKLLSSIFPLTSQHASVLQDEEQALCGLLTEFLQENVSLLMAAGQGVSGMLDEQ
jgi:hypothetical protein